MTERQFGENLDDWIVKTTEKSEVSSESVSDVFFDEAKRLFEDSRANEALTLINVAIEKDSENFKYFTLKAEILESLNRYSEADDAYSRAFKLNDIDKTREKWALMLYRWANSLNDKTKALKIITGAIEILPETLKDTYREKFWYLKGSILDCLGQPIESRICYLKAEGFSDEIKELEGQIEFLKSSKDTLISITGTRFYFGIEIFKPKMTVDLVKEPENEHDPDAVRVEIDGEKVGYVANSEYTLIENIKSASDIKDMDLKKAEVVFIYMDEHVIAKII
ncbi:HIRAN domain-containing protein [Methanobrevibacter sp.]|uniref:HIRAN domain-containing protein n=1 Tax=Methanobrevibacter sp. TaxID=66852 RepID=UPI003890401C